MLLKKCKIIVILALFFQLIVSGVAYATDHLKEDQERIQQEREAVKTMLSEAESQLSQLIQEREELNKEIDDLNGIIEEFDEMISDTEREMEENKDQLSKLEEEIELLQLDLDQRNELLKERAITYQKTGTHKISYLEVILGAESFSDFVSRLISLSKISQADNNFIEQTKLNQKELVDLQEEFEDTLLELEDQLSELEVIHEITNEEREKTERLLDQVEENEEEQENLISLLVEEEKDLGKKEEDIRKQIEEEARRQEEARRKAEEERLRELENSKQENGNNVSRGGESPSNSSEESSWRPFIATAYTAYCEGCSGITYTGINLRENPDSKIIAVDPSVIPLGSRVEIKGYGTFLAADIGGNIQGRRIDIFMQDIQSAMNFGRKSIQVRYIN